MIGTLASLVTRHDRVFLGLILVGTVFFGYHAAGIRIENDVNVLLPASSPEKTFYEMTVETFGSEEADVIALVADDVFRPETLEKVQRMTERLQAIQGIDRVVSLANVTNVWSTGDGIHVAPLMEAVPRSDLAAAKLKEDVYDNPLYRKLLVSEDATAVSINVFFSPEVLRGEARALQELDARIEEILRSEEGPETIYRSGLPSLKADSLRVMHREAAVFLSAAVLLTLPILLWFFRSFRGVLLPLACILVTLVWTMGFMVLCDSPIHLGTITLPPILVAIGLAYAMHVMAAYNEAAAQRDGRRDSGQDRAARKRLVEQALRHISLAVLVAGATTVAGFSSLMVSSIPAVRDVGKFAVFGILCATIMAVTLLPVLLSRLRIPDTSRGKPGRGETLEPALSRVAALDLRHRRAILLAVGCLAVLALYGAGRLRVETDFVSFYKEDSDLRVAHRAVGERLAGSQPFFVVLEGREPDAMKDPEVLRSMEALQAFLLRQEGVEKTLSIADHIKLLHRNMHGADPAGHRIPDDPSLIAQYLLLYAMSGDPEDLERLVDDEYRSALIFVSTNITGSRELAALVDRIDRYGREHLPRGVSATPTGSLILLTKSSDDVARGQAASLGLALVIIFGILSLLFLSLRVGLLSMIPNILPILLFFGLMGWTGITLNISTSLIACIALGIAVDDTIQFLARFNSELRRSHDERQAVTDTLRTVGQPIVLTSVVLFAAFSVGTLSQFVPLVQFGFLGAFVMLAALLGDLFFLPALLGTTKIITLWDLLAVKLGKDPHRRIPVFEGLRGSQARIIVLMSRLRRFSAGERILEKGAPGRSMYVVLQGAVEVYDTAPTSGQKRRLALHRTGELFGEVAAVRGGTRTASVKALEETELMELDERILDRLRRRYPRIAARFLQNLSRILGDRLDRLTGTYVAETDRIPAPGRPPAA